MLERIRAFFTARGVLEVETPALSRAGNTDPHIHSLAVSSGRELRYLHTSPEFPMKRLLAAGRGDIFQICRVFRAGETGRFHNPEFSLLEWYRVGWDHQRLMDEVQALLAWVLDGLAGWYPPRRVRYRELFHATLGLDPMTADRDMLAAAAMAQGIILHGAGLDRDESLDLLFAHRVAPALPEDRLTFVYDYPASQAALAQIRAGSPSVAERFEVFWGALELANGFHELRDGAEQRCRFEAERGRRRDRGLPDVAQDERLLAALDHGLPPCAGVALGLDRVLMLITAAGRIDEVLSFAWARA
jgi:lysyl-tRNA synthetase class 2